MEETPPASVGFALAGVAFVLGFGGVASSSVDLSTTGVGLPLWLGVGFLAVGMAVVDERPSLLSRVASGLRALFVGLVGLIAGSLFAGIVLSVLDVEDPATSIALLTVLAGAGLAIVGIAYLLATGRGLAYLDFEVPTLRDLGVVILGVIAIFGMLYVASIVVTALGVETTENSITQPAQEGNVETLLVLIPLSWLVIGPSEELLYRNVIQKELSETFSTWGAVAVASAVFAIAHFPAYYNPEAAVSATLTSLVIVFVLSTILGVTYVLTENVTVPALIHGTFDAVLFASLYLVFSGQIPADAATIVALVVP